MSKIKKVTAVLLSVIMLVCMFSVPAGAASYKAGDTFEYKDFSCKVLDDGTVRISKYNNEKATKVTVPASIKGMKVTEIRGIAFKGKTSLKTVILKEGLEKIGENAFSRSGIQSITIPKSVKTIDQYAFWLCKSLKTVTIKNGLESIGGAAFMGCESLKSISIPKTVKTIGGAAFANCVSLKTVKLKNGLESIEFNAFLDCSSLKSITIPKSVTVIGENALGYNSNLDTMSYEKKSDFKVYGKKGSAAETYAKENGFTFKVK